MKLQGALFCFIAAALSLAAADNAKSTAMTDNSATTAPEASKDVTVELQTTMGPVKLLLYGDTPRHLANFVKLVNEGYYDGLLFHRVINDFMVQTGDPESRNAPAGKMLGHGDPDYQIDAEFVYPKHFHKRGALAAARQGDNVNPAKRSSGSQFYIVTGKTYTPAQLDQMDARRIMARKQQIFNDLASERRDTIMAMRRSADREGLARLQDELIAKSDSMAAAAPDTLTAAQREAYSTVGGTPHLDGSYTVFGEVVSGMEVIDKIQKAETDSNDRPLKDIRIISAKVVR